MLNLELYNRVLHLKLLLNLEISELINKLDSIEVLLKSFETLIIKFFKSLPLDGTFAETASATFAPGQFWNITVRELNRMCLRNLLLNRRGVQSSRYLELLMLIRGYLGGHTLRKEVLDSTSHKVESTDGRQVVVKLRESVEEDSKEWDEDLQNTTIIFKSVEESEDESDVGCLGIVQRENHGEQRIISIFVGSYLWLDDLIDVPELTLACWWSSSEVE